MSKLLLENAHAHQIIPELALAIGEKEAIFLQQIYYWLQASKHNFEGRTWIYNSVTEWKKQFIYWSESTIKRTIKSLKGKGLILIKNFNKENYDKTNWYTIDFKAVEKLNIKIEPKKSREVPVQIETIEDKKNTTPDQDIMPIIQDMFCKMKDELMDMFKMNQPIPNINSKISNSININNINTIKPYNSFIKTNKPTPNLIPQDDIFKVKSRVEQVIGESVENKELIKLMKLKDGTNKINTYLDSWELIKHNAKKGNIAFFMNCVKTNRDIKTLFMKTDNKSQNVKESLKLIFDKIQLNKFYGKAQILIADSLILLCNDKKNIDNLNIVNKLTFENITETLNMYCEHAATTNIRHPENYFIYCIKTILSKSYEENLFGT